MKGKLMTAETIAAYRQKLIAEEKSAATVEKYLRDRQPKSASRILEESSPRGKKSSCAAASPSRWAARNHPRSRFS